MNVRSVASIWAWHRGPVLRPWDPELNGEVGVRWACPLSLVTFEPCQVLLWAWHGVKGEAMAVNEAEHTTGIVWKVVLPHPHRK